MHEIPDLLKRQVRQEAGFGCCKCGFPIIDYHHIIRCSNKPKDIMIFCPNHHREATEGAMLKKEQRQYKSNPYNIERGFVEGQLKINQKTPVVTMGSNQLIGEGDLIVVDGESLLSISINEGRLELSMTLYDENNNLVAEIKNNEWITGDNLPWDLESKYQWLRLRRKLRDIELEINAKKHPILVRADMWKNGQNIQLTPKSISLNGVAVKNFTMKNLCFVAGYFDIDTSLQKASIEINPRFPKASMIVDPDIKTRVKKGLSQLERLLLHEKREKQRNCKHEFEIEDRGIERFIHLVCKKCGLVMIKNRDEKS